MRTEGARVGVVSDGRHLPSVGAQPEGLSAAPGTGSGTLSIVKNGFSLRNEAMTSILTNCGRTGRNSVAAALAGSTRPSRQGAPTRESTIRMAAIGTLCATALLGARRRVVQPLPRPPRNTTATARCSRRPRCRTGRRSARTPRRGRGVRGGRGSGWTTRRRGRRAGAVAHSVPMAAAPAMRMWVSCWVLLREQFGNEQLDGEGVSNMVSAGPSAAVRIDVTPWQARGKRSSYDRMNARIAGRALRSNLRLRLRWQVPAVLIVEDDATLASVVAGYLERPATAPRRRRRGPEALRLIESDARPGRPRPDAARDRRPRGLPPAAGRRTRTCRSSC